MSQTARRGHPQGHGKTVRGSDVLTDFPSHQLPDSNERTARLRRAIGDFRAAGTEGRQTDGKAESVDLTPKSAHEAITRQMVTDLAANVAEIKSRVNAVLWLVAGAVAVDVVMRLVGVG
jgi:hypothetical protein